MDEKSGLSSFERVEGEQQIKEIVEMTGWEKLYEKLLNFQITFHKS
jgi:hypothetical protein